MNQLNFENGVFRVYLVIALLLILGLFVLSSLAPSVFPNYFGLVAISLIAFFLIQKIDFSGLVVLSPLLYVVSIASLVTTLVLGQITRGTSRWIELGGFQAQPAEIIRGFLLLFVAYVCSRTYQNTVKKIFFSALAIILPFVLIFLQPSLGVSLVTVVSLLAIVFVSGVSNKLIILLTGVFLILAPLSYSLLAPYQRERLEAALSANTNPQGAGYQSAQAVIATGAGMIFGRGLGSGVQTQLSFLPERHTDFIFASISEELGLVGALFTMVLGFLLPFFFIKASMLPGDVSARLYLVGAGVSIFVQSAVHIGMNLGLLPITGLPLPIVSYGGSSLLGTFIICAIALQAMRRLGTIQHI